MMERRQIVELWTQGRGSVLVTLVRVKGLIVSAARGSAADECGR